MFSEKPLFKGLLKQNSPRAEMHTAFVLEQLTEFPVTKNFSFYNLHESGNELSLGILQTMNFRNESETGSTLDSRIPKSIGFLAMSQVCKQIFQANQSLTWKFHLKTLTGRRQYRTD
jgi:hypothetical protein